MRGMCFAPPGSPSGRTSAWRDCDCGCCELEGRRGRVNIQTFRPLGSARKIDGLGQTVEVCDVDGPKMTVNVSPHEQVDVEALFA